MFSPPDRPSLQPIPSAAPKPLVVSARLINRLLSSGAASAFRLALDELRHKLSAAQAFLWVREGSHLFRLQAAAGVSEAIYEGAEEVSEATLKAAYPGAQEDWLGGVVHLDSQQHVLHRLLGRELGQVWPAQQEPPANLTLPLVDGQQVWAVLHLHTQSQHLGQAEAKWVSRFFSGVAPVLREVYLRELAQQRSLWLTAINALWRTSWEQPIELSLQAALEEATRLSGAEGGRLVAFEGRQIRTIAQTGWGAGLSLKAFMRQFAKQMGRGQSVSIPRYDLYPGRQPELVEAGLRSLFILSMSRAGILFLFSTRRWQPDVQAQEMLGALLEAIELVRAEWALRRELAWAAYTDPLTGLGNRRAFERDLEKLTAQPNGRMVVLMLLDLDDFKAINDTYGHLHADHLLVRLGGVLRSRGRAGDRAYRLGGDEFALIIEGSGTLNPQRIAERYRAMLEEIRVSDSAHLRVSLGYAIYPSEAGEAEGLWRLADKRMYEEKEQHKERPRCWQGLEVLQLETPLSRLASRLAQLSDVPSQEQRVLLAACYLLELATGRVMPIQQTQIPEDLLREAARTLMYLHTPWDQDRRSLACAKEHLPRAAHVLQVAHYLVNAIRPVEGRAARCTEQALQEIVAQAHRRFDPKVVEALLSLREWLREELS